MQTTTRQQPTSVKTFRWNPTVASYVLSGLQIAQKAGTRTGVSRFQHRYLTVSVVGWECRVTATDAGFARIAALVAEVLADVEVIASGVDSAAPFAA